VNYAAASNARPRPNPSSRRRAVRRHVPPRATPSRSAVTPATAARMGIMEDYLPETPRFPIAEEHRPTSRKGSAVPVSALFWVLISSSETPLRCGARPRSSADRATDFESVRGGSTPPGATPRESPARCAGHDDFPAFAGRLLRPPAGDGQARRPQRMRISRPEQGGRSADTFFASGVIREEKRCNVSPSSRLLS
jgi:hypothetical protein